MLEPYTQYCTSLQSTGKYRILPRLSDNPILDFSTNDYLSLSAREELLKSAYIAGNQYGVGSTGSRLLSGNRAIFEELERQIALDKKTEAALIFNSGFQANLTVLASLLDLSVLKSNPVVFFDKFNHSSLYQAIFLSKAQLIRYKHNDMDHLSSLLLKFQNDPKPKFIVTETIFGMDGDILPIGDFLSIAKKNNAFIYLDEAHATGVIGENGYGLSTQYDLKTMPHLIMGTFSKALGCSGAYIACSQVLKDYLINNAKGFIYSTSPSPMVIGAALKAWHMVRDLNNERKELFLKAAKLRISLKDLGFDTGRSASHIIPIILGTEKAVTYAHKSLMKAGIMVSNIRPPTVPNGSSRLRIALNISHTDQDIERLINELIFVYKKLSQI